MTESLVLLNDLLGTALINVTILLCARALVAKNRNEKRRDFTSAY